MVPRPGRCCLGEYPGHLCGGHANVEDPAALEQRFIGVVFPPHSKWRVLAPQHGQSDIGGASYTLSAFLNRPEELVNRARVDVVGLESLLETPLLVPGDLVRADLLMLE